MQTYNYNSGFYCSQHLKWLDEKVKKLLLTNAARDAPTAVTPLEPKEKEIKKKRNESRTRVSCSVFLFISKFNRNK